MLPILTIVLPMIFACSAWAQTPLYEVAVSKYLMGTRVDATVMHGDVNAAREALVRAFMEMERVEGRMSIHIAESEISKINAHAGQAPLRVSAETFALLERARGYGEQYEGLFDITIGPLSTLWGFRGDAPVTVPPAEALTEARRLIDIRNLVLHPSDTTAFLTTPGMRLDLGGVAKGYAIDRAVAVLRGAGIDNFLLNAGGDLYVSGQKSEGQPWKVGIKHPRNADSLVARLELRNQAIATSGDYERFVELDGQRYHHILDPRTGHPARQSRSVTVLAATAEEADALATYLFILGLDQPSPAPFIGVDANGHLHYAPALAEDSALTLFQ